MYTKVKTIDEIREIVRLKRKKGKKIVTTNGAFDMLHVGHARCLDFAKKQGDVLVVGLNSDLSIKRYKSEKRPIIPEKERVELLSYLTCVDYIILFGEETPLNFLNTIKPDIHVKGIEYRKNLLEKKLVEKNGGKIVFREREDKEVTTSKIIDKILKSYGEKNAD
jgi:rfaE bifunctional protein nucleotidyltransferase chain/domain